MKTPKNLERLDPPTEKLILTEHPLPQEAYARYRKGILACLPKRGTITDKGLKRKVIKEVRLIDFWTSLVLEDLWISGTIAKFRSDHHVTKQAPERYFWASLEK